jgi:hypothetical protein
MSGPAVQQTYGGAADDYFQEGQQQQPYPPQEGFAPQQPQYGYEKNGTSNDGAYASQPQQHVPMNTSQEGKQSFDQAFVIAKPKWNDLWAAILFLATFAGFIAVSGLSIRGYTVTQGSSNGSSTFGLNRLTIVLL